MSQLYVITAESFRPRDEWLVGQLLAQNQRLVTRLEELQGMTPEQQIELNALTALSQESAQPLILVSVASPQLEQPKPLRCSGDLARCTSGTAAGRFLLFQATNLGFSIAASG